MRKILPVVLTAVFAAADIAAIHFSNHSVFKNERSESDKTPSLTTNNTSCLDPFYDSVGMTPEIFENKFGDEWVLYLKGSEYSDEIEEGCISHVETASDFYQRQQRDGRTVLFCYTSDGKSSNDSDRDMKNLVDPCVYFSEPENEYINSEYVISHNEFYLSNGEMCTVDITDSSGEMHIHASSEHERKALCYNYDYDGHFILVLDDYNNDNNPDFVIRVCNKNGKGGYYSLNRTETDSYYCYGQSLNIAGRSEPSFYICGTTEDSVRLDHIDKNHFFFLTENDGEICPAVFDSGFRRCDAEDYMIRDRLFSAFYSEGTLYLKATNSKENMNTFDGTANITIRHLDGSIWRKVSQTEKLTFSERTKEQISRERDIDGFIHGFLENDHFISIARKNIELQKGLYSIEIEVPGDEIFYLDFYVR